MPPTPHCTKPRLTGGTEWKWLGSRRRWGKREGGRILLSRAWCPFLAAIPALPAQPKRGGLEPNFEPRRGIPEFAILAALNLLL